MKAITSRKHSSTRNQVMRTALAAVLLPLGAQAAGIDAAAPVDVVPESKVEIVGKYENAFRAETEKRGGGGGNTNRGSHRPSHGNI